METLKRVLDLKQFAWTKDHAWYTVIAVTKFQDQDIVVYRAEASGLVGVATVSDFCREFQATYQLT